MAFHSGRLGEVGSLGTNREGERKLGRGDPVTRKLSKNEKLENRGSSSVAGEISELSGNSAGLSLSGEEPERESEIGGNLFSPIADERNPPKLVVPSEKSFSDPEENFLEQHHLQFSALLERTNMGNFSTDDWELFMAYKVSNSMLNIW